MKDLVEKLRATADDTDAVENSSVAYLLEEAAAEIERLRLTDVEREAVQRAAKDEDDFGLVYTADVLQSLLDRLSANGDCPKPDNAAKQDILTDAERAAIERAMKDENDFGMVYTADVLKWLLERTK